MQVKQCVIVRPNLYSFHLFDFSYLVVVSLKKLFIDSFMSSNISYYNKSPFKMQKVGETKHFFNLLFNFIIRFFKTNISVSFFYNFLYLFKITIYHLQSFTFELNFHIFRALYM